jgi:replicative DNA helicase
MKDGVAFADEVAEVENPNSALHNLEAEQALLGAVISQKEALSKVEHIITPDDFFEPVHQDLYGKILAIRDDGGMLTYTIVKAKLGAYGAHDLGGLTAAAYAARLAAEAAVPNEVVPLARAVRDMAQRRALVHIGAVLKEMAEDDAPIMDATMGAMAAIDAIVASRSDPHTRPVSIGDAARGSILRMQAAVSTADYMPGMTSGLRSIDHMTGGFKRGEFIVIAGRPGMGKSGLAITVARLQAEAAYNTLLFTLEMTSHDVADRAIADAAWTEVDPIPYQNMGRGRVSREQQQRLTNGALAFDRLPLIIEPQAGLTLSQIGARARKHKQNLERVGKTLDAVFLDHMHIVRPSNRYQGRSVQEVTEISNGLKALAKEVNVPVIALAQLNRGVESRDNKRPTMSDLRESGSIEQDADLIFMMYREAYYLERLTGGTPEAEALRLNRLADVMNVVELDIVKQPGEQGCYVPSHLIVTPVQEGSLRTAVAAPLRR